ncbi:MAG TPA: purine-nucleoside phosphorylase [Polyangiaceae bacterium]|nr:purine-nucleoside phosphorylase [Polyangiaceae bacterium]
MTILSPGPNPPPTPAARLAEALDWLAPRIPRPQLGLVLGSGLGHFAARLEDPVRVPYADIPHMPLPAVSGHGGELCVGRLGKTTVACLSGRAHAYEGHAPEKVVFGVRLLARLGVDAVLLTNAAGGIGDDLAPGRLLVIDDHLNLTGLNPLVGANVDEWGPRFPDMTQAYDAELRARLGELGRQLGLDLAHGTYAGLLGPSYETPAEIRMLETLGARAVGMSTVLETIALRHLGVRVAGVSCITNLAAGKSHAPLDHDEVKLVADRVRDDFSRLLVAFCSDPMRS